MAEQAFTPLSNTETAAFCSQMAMILHSGISTLEGVSVGAAEGSSVGWAVGAWVPSGVGTAVGSPAAGLQAARENSSVNARARDNNL